MLPLPGAQVRSLVRDLRSPKLCGLAKRKGKFPCQPHTGKCAHTHTHTHTHTPRTLPSPAASQMPGTPGRPSPGLWCRERGTGPSSGGTLEQDPENPSAPKCSFPILPRGSFGPGGVRWLPRHGRTVGADGRVAAGLVASTGGGRGFCLEAQPPSRLSPALRS